MRFKVRGVSTLEKAFQKYDRIQWQKIARKNILQIKQRASSPPGTPRDTGELILSRRMKTEGSNEKWKTTFFYTKDYAPFVEFGHRTRGGGYVKGQRYLKNNVDIQRHIYKEDMKRVLKK